MVDKFKELKDLTKEELIKEIKIRDDVIKMYVKALEIGEKFLEMI